MFSDGLGRTKIDYRKPQVFLGVSIRYLECILMDSRESLRKD